MHISFYYKEDFKSDEDEEDGYDQTDDGADDESEDDNESVDGEKNGGMWHPFVKNSYSLYWFNYIIWTV